jgi:hypothetical protein
MTKLCVLVQAECNPRLALQPDVATGMEAFLAICQGMPAPAQGGGGGGGH